MLRLLVHGDRGTVIKLLLPFVFLGRIPVPRDILQLMPELTKETPLDYLIPSTTGNGICTTSLVDYLVQIHNEFIRRCQAIIADEQDRYVHHYLYRKNVQFIYT